MQVQVNINIYLPLPLPFFLYKGDKVDPLRLFDHETQFPHLQYGKLLHSTEDTVKTKRDNPKKNFF